MKSGSALTAQEEAMDQSQNPVSRSHDTPSEGAARLAESEWRHARQESESQARHPSNQQPHTEGDVQSLRGIEWEKARPNDHTLRKGQVGSQQQAGPKE